MKTALKIILVTLICCSLLIFGGVAAYFGITHNLTLDAKKLIDYGKTITFYDDEGNKIEDASAYTKNGCVEIAKLDKNTINAFIASEDRTFYRHNGINFKRLCKAAYTNLKAKSFKEGASTISQQLIKNTHLSGDKTLLRKIKEFKLTRELEKSYTKDEILEMYLNTIYFGHNCYGLQNAARFYFSVSAEELTLEQSATLAGLLSSPNNYSPFKNAERCVKKRNGVLKSMRECGFIDEKTYKENLSAPLSAVENTSRGANSRYLSAAFAELDEKNLDPYIACGGLDVETYLDSGAQAELEKLDLETDGTVILRGADGGIIAYSSTVGDIKRQIGSTAKPLLVYAPALEEGKIQLFTKICDEPVNYGGYSPENYDKKYHGNVSVEDSIKYSYNVPAVKTLNAIGVETAERYAKKLRINLTEGDKNLSLALGGTESGISLKTLCDAYGVFQSGGSFTPSRYIKKITDKSGNVLYSAKKETEKVYSAGTCSLINRALIGTVKGGTAKRLNAFDFDVACKTGTCGNAEGNTDAYSIAYNSEVCCGVWLGNKSGERGEFTGGGSCCEIAKNVFEKLYKDKSCAPLEVNAGVKQIEIDREDYEKDSKIELCDEVCPKLNRLTVYCSASFEPSSVSTRFSSPKIKKPTQVVENDKILINLCQTKYYEYLIKCYKNGNYNVVYDGDWVENFVDEQTDGEYVYSVTPYFHTQNKNYYGEEIFLPQVKISLSPAPSPQIPDIAKKDWTKM